MSEETEVPIVCDDCGGNLTNAGGTIDDLFSMALGEDRPHYWHMEQSGCIASLNERLTAATERAEAAEAKYGVANECHEYALRLYKETKAECDALRKDAARLREAIDIFISFQGSTREPEGQAALDAALAVQPTTGEAK